MSRATGACGIVISPTCPTPRRRAGASRRAGGRPDYKVYKSRPGLLEQAALDRPRGAARAASPARGRRRRRSRRRRERRWLRWILIAIGVWILISFLAFAISAQIQRFKLESGASKELSGNPLLLPTPQTILLLGSDRRDEETAEPTFDPDAPSRADTIMLLRVGGGTFRKLSIPRDSFAAIPGHDAAEDQRRLRARRHRRRRDQGNTSLMVETVENFLGVDVDHVVLVDFEGFKDFIDAIGGVEVDLPDKLCSEISGGEANGGFTKHFGPGEETLDGDEALILARTRINTLPPEGRTRTSSTTTTTSIAPPPSRRSCRASRAA